MKANICLTFTRKCGGFSLLTTAMLLVAACGQHQNSAKTSVTTDSTNFKAQVAFLEKYTPVITLQRGNARVAVSAALQGRVMTSTSDGDEGLSYGWINQKAFTSGDTSEHMNAFGGEDRFWLGPEGGQFSIYFEKGSPFDFDHWHVPRLIDLEPFDVVSVSDTQATFSKSASLTNYSGTVFQFQITREVKLMNTADMFDEYNASSVAYQTINTLKNAGRQPWEKETGLLSIWILGMYNPSKNTTVVIPHRGQGKPLRELVNDNYFGSVPDDRLKSDNKAIYFRADGEYRSKIGLAPDAVTGWMGSYDADNKVLTLVSYGKPDSTDDYVNSSWEIQKEPFRGDVINAYNDGAPSPGVAPMGPFYELESSSPAAMLAPGDSLVHIHTTFHIRGPVEGLNYIAINFLGVSINQITDTFK